MKKIDKREQINLQIVLVNQVKDKEIGDNTYLQVYFDKYTKIMKRIVAIPKVYDKPTIMMQALYWDVQEVDTIMLRDKSIHKTSRPHNVNKKLKGYVEGDMKNGQVNK
jgi:hypothetical protein